MATGKLVLGIVLVVVGVLLNVGLLGFALGFTGTSLSGLLQASHRPLSQSPIFGFGLFALILSLPFIAMVIAGVLLIRAARRSAK